MGLVLGGDSGACTVPLLLVADLVWVFLSLGGGLFPSHVPVPLLVMLCC